MREKRSDVRKAKRRVSPICAKVTCVKKKATPSTNPPVKSPRNIPPVINQKIIIEYGVGDTSISSIFF
jgi:hypothetical protein